MRNEIAMARQTRTPLVRQVEPLRNRLLESEKNQIVAQKPSATADNLRSRRQLPSSPVTLALNQLDYVLDHPELRATYARLLAYYLGPNWGMHVWPFLNLSANQKQALTQLLNDYGYSVLDAGELARANGMTDSEFNSVMTQVTKSFLDEGRQIFGEATYQKMMQNEVWHPIEYNTPALNTADLLAGGNDPTQPTMSVQQETQLANILLSNQFTTSRAAPSGANMMGGVLISDDNFDRMQSRGPPLTIITDAAIAQAKAVLSPAQVEALRNLQTLQLAQLGSSAETLKPTK